LGDTPAVLRKSVEEADCKRVVKHFGAKSDKRVRKREGVRFQNGKRRVHWEERRNRAALGTIIHNP
jgi:hypothetical protein